VAAVNMAFQEVSVCQSRGRCNVSSPLPFLPERASRAGTGMSWSRMVTVVARTWNAPARQPVARVRLNAIAASASQAALALNRPEVI
jgi:hypothetical protein